MPDAFAPLQQVAPSSARDRESSLTMASAFAARYDAAEVVDDIERLLVQLRQQRLTIVIAGQYSRGKSTLVNALIGAPILPMGLLPITAVPTVIRRGDRERTIVQYRDWRREDIELGALADIVSEERNPGNRLGVRRVEVETPALTLANVDLVDAPGVGTPHDVEGKVALTALRLADLAVLVVGPEPPITAAELAFAAEVERASQTVYVVINKADLAGPALADVVTFTRDRLAEALGEAPPIYAVNAKDALLAPTDTGEFAIFRADLVRVLSERGSTLLSDSVDRRARTDIAQLLRRVDVERSTIAAPLDARRAALDRLAQLEDELTHRRPELLEGFRNGMLADVQALDDHLAHWIRDAQPSLVEKMRTAAASGSDVVFQSALDQIATCSAAEWRGRAQELLRASATVRARRLQRSFDELRAESFDPVFELLGITELPTSPPAADIIIPDLGPVERFATTGTELTLAAAFHLLPRTIRAQALARTVPERVFEALDRERGRLLSAVRDCVAEIVRQSSADISAWFDVEVAIVHRAITRGANITSEAEADALGRLDMDRQSLVDLDAVFTAGASR